MKITDIQIDHYGVWRHLALPLPSAGLNVFYGPNEAGKTTLFRFIRDVLYDRERNPRGLSRAWSGALRLSSGDEFAEARRSMDSAGGHSVAFQELNPDLAWNTVPDWALSASKSKSPAIKGTNAEDILAEWLAQTPARVFQQVFAIGLSELQESATLQDEEIARRIYGLSLGWEGKRLIEISEKYSTQKDRALAPEIALEIEELTKRDLELESELELYADYRDRHQRLSKERASLASRVSGTEGRRAELERRLRGHQAIQQLWEPWKQVRDYETELGGLPAAVNLKGLDTVRLDQCEQEIRELTRERKSVIADIKRLRDEWRSVKKTTSSQGHSAQIDAFLSQKDWVRELEAELELCAARSRELKTEFEARHQALGKDWPIHRLSATETNRAAYERLVDAAQKFQSAENRLASRRKRYDKLSTACHQEQGQFDQKIKALPEKTLVEAIQATRAQIANVKELARLKERERELAVLVEKERSEQSRKESRSALPAWVPGFLMFLAASGMVLSALGFYTGLTSNGITGAILCLVGVAGFAISRGFQIQTTSRWEERIESETQSYESKLRQLQSEIQRNTPDVWVVNGVNGQPPAPEKLKARLIGLKKIRSEGRKLRSRRRRLSRMRETLQDRQRRVAEARQAWCETLKKCGLNETLPIEKAFELWQRITETKEHHRAWQVARISAEDAQDRHGAFCQRLAQFGRSAGYHQLDYNQPLQVLEAWETDPHVEAAETAEPSPIKQEYKGARRKANHLKRQIFKARAARLVFLAKAGAANRKQFEARLDAAQRRRELEELLELARGELAEVSAGYNDLAIMEDDLVNYDEAANQDAIDLILLEIEELDAQSGDTPARLNQIDEELEELESERRPAEIRLEREMIKRRLRECLTEQAATMLAAKSVREIRGRFEKSCQPELLDVASDYLAQLTCGKYHRIWTTLGEQDLQITDAEGQSRTVGELSSGTREQLFLALRLGLVQDYANQGAELPLVLDDVLVNFDQYRTEAAIQTLIEFADRGHQVLLFTSHVHVARICEEQGINPIWLPAHQHAIERRRAG